MALSQLACGLASCPKSSYSTSPALPLLPPSPPTSTLSSMAGLARPVRTVLKLRLTESRDLSMRSICAASTSREQTPS